MLYELAQWLSVDVKLRAFNVFTYITLRVVLAALTEAAAREAAAGATILVKGSRFMRMERVADALAQKGGGHVL